jgi:transposase-like protein
MKSKLTEQDRADIIRLVGKGQAIAVLAEDFGVTEQAIRYTVKQGAKKAKIQAPALEQAEGGVCGPLEAMRKDGIDVLAGKTYTLKTKEQHEKDHNVETRRINRLTARATLRAAVRDFCESELRDEIGLALAEVFQQGVNE